MFLLMASIRKQLGLLHPIYHMDCIDGEDISSGEIPNNHINQIIKIDCKISMWHALSLKKRRRGMPPYGSCLFNGIRKLKRLTIFKKCDMK